MIELDNLYNQDCIIGLKKVDKGTVNCVITSPPYNVGLSYNEYDDNKEYEDYLLWISTLFKELYRVLAIDGRMCINIGDGKNGLIPTHSDFIQIAKNTGFLCMTTIIWNKNNTSNRTAWGSFMSASSPSFPRNFEYILIFSKTKKLMHSGITTIYKDDFIRWTNGLWTMNTEKSDKVNHPAPFPIELPIRLIRLLTYKYDVILDPFIGSGTTAIACIRERRHYIGFEIDEYYYNNALSRINKEKSQLTIDFED